MNNEVIRRNNCLIYNNNQEKYVVKKKNNSQVSELFKYLKARNFNNFPKILNNTRSDEIVYEFIEDVFLPPEQKALDLVDTLSALHQKTTYYKEILPQKNKELMERISNNINYYLDYYDKLATEIENEIYMSPSHYFFIRHYTKIRSALLFCEDELNNWYELEKDETQQKVSVIHNNVRLDHLIINENNYLISWDNAKIDSPVLDMINFYQNEYNKVNFKEIWKKYLNSYNLSDSEKKLFFIVVSIPQEIKFTNHEFSDINICLESINYLFKTEELTRPYYANDEIKEENDFD